MAGSALISHRIVPGDDAPLVGVRVREAIARLFEAFDGVDLLSRVSSLDIPVLIVNGEHDMSLPGARETAQLLPDVIHRVIPDTGHLCCFEDPAAFDAMVVEFLRSRGLMPGSAT